MESIASFWRKKRKKKRKLSAQIFSVPYTKVRGMLIFFSSNSLHNGFKIGCSLSSPVGGLSFDWKKILLQSGLTDTTMGSFICIRLYIVFCDFMVAAAVVAMGGISGQILTRTPSLLYAGLNESQKINIITEDNKIFYTALYTSK